MVQCHTLRLLACWVRLTFTLNLYLLQINNSLLLLLHLGSSCTVNLALQLISLLQQPSCILLQLGQLTFCCAHLLFQSSNSSCIFWLHLQCSVICVDGSDAQLC